MTESRTKEKFSVLLVDDDPTVIRVFSRILADYTPLRFATSGRVALKLAHDSPPDLVMLDVEMPDFNGFETCKAFKSDPALAAIPVIFITGHESPHLETAGLQLGAADFISKPPNASMVLARVRTHQQLKALADTVRSAVTMDFLTGTVTRRQLEKTVAQEWLRAQRSCTPLSLLLIDIDRFTAFNARHGEDSGDACLHELADALRAVVHRPGDVLARYGGGKFALLLPDTASEGTAAIAKRALRAVEKMPPAARITLSVGGISTLARGAPSDLFAGAERALQSAKDAGGNRACFAGDGALLE